jgi:hypothetical protein
MQHATERVERPGESQEALDGKKKLSTKTDSVNKAAFLREVAWCENGFLQNVRPQRQDSPVLDVEQQHFEMDANPNNRDKDSVTSQNAKGDSKLRVRRYRAFC